MQKNLVIENKKQTKPPRLNKLALPCIHLGQPTGETRDCELCGGKKGIPLHHCAQHGECTVENVLKRKVPGQGIVQTAWCRVCPDHRVSLAMPFTREPTRHLLMHIFPRKDNDVWRRNVQELLQRISLFNGRRIVAIAVGSGAEKAQVVREALKPHVQEFIEIPNNPRKRDFASHEQLWNNVLTNDPDQVAFWCHAKGVTHPGRAWRWTEILWRTNLDCWPLVQEQLQQHACTGSMRKVRGYRHKGSLKPSPSQFHYHGSFLWVRLCHLQGRNWQNPDQGTHVALTWPGCIFSPAESGCLFLDSPRTWCYNDNHVKGVVEPALAKWEQENRERLRGFQG